MHRGWACALAGTFYMHTRPGRRREHRQHAAGTTDLGKSVRGEEVVLLGRRGQRRRRAAIEPQLERQEHCQGPPSSLPGALSAGVAVPRSEQHQSTFQSGINPETCSQNQGRLRRQMCKSTHSPPPTAQPRLHAHAQSQGPVAPCPFPAQL